jgi:hypothetical protein
VASFQFAVQATYSQIDYTQKIAYIDLEYSRMLLSIEGIDAESNSGLAMRSELVPVNMQQGADMCPIGSILALDQGCEVNCSAACSPCKPGTYSVDPLAPGSIFAAPACIGCPAGAKCLLGGADVRFNEGETWLVVDGVYKLEGCPAGSQLINSTAGTSRGTFSNSLQQCRACLVGEYIINPQTDSCQQCPPGKLSVLVASLTLDEAVSYFRILSSILPILISL